jgi:hypothetical protein
VTRFGEFFTLGSVLKITEVAQIFDYALNSSSYVVIFDKKLAQLHFGATFSQTHLVTLQSRHRKIFIKKHFNK